MGKPMTDHTIMTRLSEWKTYSFCFLVIFQLDINVCWSYVSGVIGMCWSYITEVKNSTRKVYPERKHVNFCLGKL